MTGQNGGRRISVTGRARLVPGPVLARGPQPDPGAPAIGRQHRAWRIAALLAVALLAAAVLAGPAGAVDAQQLARLRAALDARPDDMARRTQLGDALFRDGQALASMVVLNPGRKPDPSWVPELQKAAGIYASVGRIEPAARALRNAIRLAPDDTSLYAELKQLYADAGIAAPELPEPPSSAQEPPPAPTPAKEEAPAQTVTDVAVAERVGGATREGGWLARPANRRRAGLALGALGLLVVILAARSLLRGKGDLAVAIEVPADRRGTFSVRLTRKRERSRPRREGIEPKARASSRFEHNLIARETHFRGIPARSYWVVVEGLLETSDGAHREAVREEQEVPVTRGLTARAEFDLRPQGCPVEVRLLRGGKPVPGRVALARDPTSLKLARGGVATLTLAEGSYSLLAGAGDRATERPLEIEGFAPRVIELDLDDPTILAFEGCQPAVEPFLRGDLSVTAAALEREGLNERADLLLARFHQNHGSADSAADRFEAAGSWHEAAEQRAQAGEYLRAAELFEKVGDLPRAAEMYNADGDLLRAGRAYEEAGDFEAAIICYREAGDAPRLLDALEKSGECFTAAKLALERDDVPRAVRNFQQVGPRDPHYFEACRTLASLFSEQGKLELAVQKADEAITFSRPEDTSADTFVWYGNLLARAGRPERALQIFSDLAERSPDHPGVETRIEALKKEVSQRQKESSATEALAVPFGETSRYEIVEEIGSGGMGIVFRARDRRLGREVALKRLPDSLKDHPRAVDLFLREARAAAALNHGNIVTVHDVDQEDGLFFITMELMVGRPLSEVLRERGRLSAADAARIGLEVAAGLGYAHERRIVHRDIKTANLFFTEDRTLKIMDFGLAKMLEEVRRATTVVGGTPYYMAPEQSAGEAVDGRADLYAFGVTLYELLTGRRPFEEGDVAYQHRHDPPPDPRTLAPDIPDAFAELILQMLAKDPADRPATAEQVAAALRTISGRR